MVSRVSSLNMQFAANNATATPASAAPATVSKDSLSVVDNRTGKHLYK
jgi:hypothetical protein